MNSRPLYVCIDDEFFPVRHKMNENQSNWYGVLVPPPVPSMHRVITLVLDKCAVPAASSAELITYDFDVGCHEPCGAMRL